MISHEKIAWQGWPNCYRLSNHILELIITADVGPRILYCGLHEGFNHLKIFTETVGQMGGTDFRFYGGHRFWHAPERPDRTYAPDNEPVHVEPISNGLRFTPPVESITRVQKELDVILSEDAAHVQVVHRLRNHNLWTVEVAPWAISIMASGGKVIMPLSPRSTHDAQSLLPTDRLILWSYAELDDPRYVWGKKYIIIRQDSDLAHAQKIGLANDRDWIAYVNADQLFLKKFTNHTNANYPDFGSMMEMYTRGEMIEIETLAPLTHLAPHAIVEHIEHWFLFDEVPLPTNDEDVDRDILPLVESVSFS